MIDDFIGNAIISFRSVPPDVKIKYAQEIKKRKKQEEAGLIKFELFFEKFHQQRMVYYNKDEELSQFDNAFIDSFKKNLHASKFWGL